MIGWALSLWTGLSLRVRLVAIALLSLLVGVGYFWLRWKLASRKAKTAQEWAEKLQATRELEARIAESRSKARAKHDKLRQQIRTGKRDYFEH